MRESRAGRSNATDNGKTQVQSRNVEHTLERKSRSLATPARDDIVAEGKADPSRHSPRAGEWVRDDNRGVEGGEGMTRRNGSRRERFPPRRASLAKPARDDTVGMRWREDNPSEWLARERSFAKPAQDDSWRVRRARQCRAPTGGGRRRGGGEKADPRRKRPGMTRSGGDAASGGDGALEAAGEAGVFFAQRLGEAVGEFG